MKQFENKKTADQIEFITGAFCALGLLVLTILFIIIGIKCYISDSEIWSITLAKNISREWMHPWVFTRPLFYLFYSIFVALSDKASSIFFLAKIAATLNGVLIAILTYQLAKLIAGSEKRSMSYLPIFTVVLLLANTSFINQGTRIRSDLLATAFILFAFIETLKASGQPTLRVKLLWLTPLLATPKAIFQVFSFIVLDIPRKYKIYLIDALVLFTLGTFLFYPQVIDYIKSTFAIAFFDSEQNFNIRWMYLTRMIGLNWVFVGFLVCRFFIFPVRLYLNAFENPNSRKNHESLAKLALVFAIVFTLTPEKVPFLLAAYLPIFTIYAAMLLSDLESLIKIVVPKKRELFYQRAVRVSFVFLTFSLSLGAICQANDILRNDNSNAQINAVNNLESYLNSYPKASHFDIIGILPQRTKFRIFASPNDEKLNEYASNWFQENPTDLIFLTNKFNLLGEKFFHFFYENYASLGAGVYAKWFYLNKNQQSKSSLIKEFDRLSKEVGKRDSDSITALIVRVPMHAQIFSAPLPELLKMKAENPNLYVIGISPFAAISPDFGYLYNLFTFDVDY